MEPRDLETFVKFYTSVCVLYTQKNRKKKQALSPGILVGPYVSFFLFFPFQKRFTETSCQVKPLGAWDWLKNRAAAFKETIVYSM